MLGDFQQISFLLQRPSVVRSLKSVFRQDSVRIFGGSDRVKAASLIAGLLVCYLFGTLWFTLGYNSGSGSVTFTAALGLCVLPFVVPDLLKLGLAFWVAKQIRKRRGQ